MRREPDALRLSSSLLIVCRCIRVLAACHHDADWGGPWCVASTRLFLFTVSLCYVLLSKYRQLAKVSRTDLSSSRYFHLSRWLLK